MTSNYQPTGAADEQFDSNIDLVLRAMEQYFDAWKCNGSILLPPIFLWTNPELGEEALKAKAEEAQKAKAEADEASAKEKELKEKAKVDVTLQEKVVEASKLVQVKSRVFDTAARFRVDDVSSAGEFVVYRAFNELINSEYFSDLAPLCGIRGLVLRNVNWVFDEKVWREVFDKWKQLTTTKKNKAGQNTAIVLGEIDFIIIGPQIGIVCVEVKSSLFDKTRGNAFPPDLTDGLQKFARTTELMKLALERSTGIAIDESIPFRRVLLLTNVEESRFNAWVNSVPEELSGLTVWYKEKLENSQDDDSKGPLFSTLLEFLCEMAIDVDSLEPNQKQALRVIYEAYVPTMVAMKSLVMVGKTAPGCKELDEEQLSLLRAIMTENEKIDNFGQPLDANTMIEVKKKSSKKPTTAKSAADLKNPKKKIFCQTPGQQLIADGGPRQFIFGAAGVGKTMLIMVKIQELITKEKQTRQQLKEAGVKSPPQLPVLVYAPESISAEYETFLDECGFEKGVDYEIKNGSFAIRWLFAAHKVFATLLIFACKTGNYLPILCMYLMFQANEPGPKSFGQKALPLACIAMRNAVKKGLSGMAESVPASFESEANLVEMLKLINVDDNFICTEEQLTALIDRLKLDTHSDLAYRLRKIETADDLVFTKITNEIDGTSDLEILIRFIDDALDDGRVFQQLKEDIICTPVVYADGTASGNSHIFIDDTLDTRFALLHFPHTHEAVVFLLMKFFKRVDTNMYVWVAVDPYLSRFVDHLDQVDQEIAEVEHLRISSEANALHDVMRCSTALFNHCYGSGWHKLFAPRSAHKYQGTAPITKRAENFETFNDARDALWLKVEETIRVLKDQGFVESQQFALIVGDSTEKTLCEFLKAKCDECFCQPSQSHLDHPPVCDVPKRARANVHQMVYSWDHVSSLEWPIVIYANILPKKFLLELDVVQRRMYERYRGISRAKVHLIEFEYLYEEAGEEEEKHHPKEGTPEERLAEATAKTGRTFWDFLI